MVKRRKDDDAGVESITLPGFYRYVRWKCGSIAYAPDARVWLYEGDTRDRLIARDRAYCADPLWRRRKGGPLVDILRLELDKPVCFPRRSIDVRPVHSNEIPGERISWPEAADFVRETRAHGVDWLELWPDDGLIPIVDDEVDPRRYWGDD
jgi:hypothetical protein